MDHHYDEDDDEDDERKDDDGDYDDDSYIIGAVCLCQLNKNLTVTVATILSL